MESKTGIVGKIRILQMSERPLIFFKLNNLNCLISLHSLNFLADVQEGMMITIAGIYNSKKQFVTRKYAVHGKTQIMVDFETLNFPAKKNSICR